MDWASPAAEDRGGGKNTSVNTAPALTPGWPRPLPGPPTSHRNFMSCHGGRTTCTEICAGRLCALALASFLHPPTSPFAHSHSPPTRRKHPPPRSFSTTSTPLPAGPRWAGRAGFLLGLSPPSCSSAGRRPRSRDDGIGFDIRRKL